MEPYFKVYVFWKFRIILKIKYKSGDDIKRRVSKDGVTIRWLNPIVWVYSIIKKVKMCVYKPYWRLSLYRVRRTEMSKKNERNYDGLKAVQERKLLPKMMGQNTVWIKPNAGKHLKRWKQQIWICSSICKKWDVYKRQVLGGTLANFIENRLMRFPVIYAFSFYQFQL